METNENKDNDFRSKWTDEGVEAFLASSSVPGIGKVYAKRLVEKYGRRVIEMLKDDPSSVTGVLGVGESRLVEASAGIRNSGGSVDVEVALYSAGVANVFVDRIFEKYRKRTAEVIADDPYSMVENVWRLSFFTADKIGKMIGVEPDDPRRLRGALLTAVKHFAEEGHVFALEDEAVKYAASITGAGPVKIAEQLPALEKDGRLVRDMDGLYLPVYYRAEKEAAEKIRRILSSELTTLSPDDIPRVNREGHIYTPLQRKAIETALTHPVSIITGGPGSGKTTVLNGIIDILEKENKKTVLVAPTGRAAKRMSALTGADASTIHRLLGYRQGEGYRKKKIVADYLIIDEGSMLEQVLFDHLLDTVGEGVAEHPYLKALRIEYFGLKSENPKISRIFNSQRVKISLYDENIGK